MEFVSGGGDMVVMVMFVVVDEVVFFFEGELMDIDVVGFWLFVQQGGCVGLFYGMCFDNELEDDDMVVEQYGFCVFVDFVSMNYIGGLIFDFEGGL